MFEMKEKIINWLRSNPNKVKRLQLFLTALLPTLLSIFYSYKVTQEYFNQQSILSNVLLIFSVGIVLPFVGNYIYEKWIYEDTHERYNTVFNVLAAIDNVVDSKRKRFYEAIKEVTNENAFQTITQPIVQLNLLTSALCNVITSLAEVKKLKFTLILCNEDGLERYLSIVGDDKPTLTIDELNKNESLAKHVFNTKHDAYIDNTNIKVNAGIAFLSLNIVKQIRCIVIQ